jgi:hypothetical protein
MLETSWERFGNMMGTSNHNAVVGSNWVHHPNYVFYNYYFIKKYKSRVYYSTSYIPYIILSRTYLILYNTHGLYNVMGSKHLEPTL